MDEATVFFPRRPTEIGPGVRLNDTYSILEFVGEGGVSQVYRGFNIHTGQRVAVKFLRPEVTNDPDTRELFRREATILSELHHEAIVRYLGYSFDPALGREYLVMEFVEGVSLKRRLATGALTRAETLALKTRLAWGLAAAHRMGVVHRDISPDNVVLPGGEIERAKIIDFGIARASMFTESTVIGDGFAGKFAYISPEQVAGETVTPASDIYSLGLVLAEASIGAPLDMGKTLAELAPRRALIPDLAALDPSLRPLISRMLRPRPADRIPDMETVATWSPEPERLSTPLARPSRLGVVLAALGAAIMAASLAGLAYVYYAGPARVAEGDAPAPVVSPAPLPTGSAPPAAQPETPAAVATPAPAQTRPTATPEPPPSPVVASSPYLVASAPPLEDFVRGFDGGPCWLARVTPGGGVEAMAAKAETFQRFADSWTTRLGSPAKFDRLRLDPAQCPALDLLRSADPASPPVVSLRSREVGGRTALAGVVGGLAGRALTLLVVGDDGRALSLKYAAQGGDEAAFSLGVEKVDPEDVGHSLAVLALVSDAPPAALEGLGADQPRPVASVGKLADLVAKLTAAGQGGKLSAALAVATLVKQ